MVTSIHEYVEIDFDPVLTRIGESVICIPSIDHNAPDHTEDWVRSIDARNIMDPMKVPLINWELRLMELTGRRCYANGRVSSQGQIVLGFGVFMFNAKLGTVNFENCTTNEGC